MRVFTTNDELADKLSPKDFEVATPSEDIQFTIKLINEADVVIVVGDKIGWSDLGMFWWATYTNIPTIVIDNMEASTWRDYYATKVVANIDEALVILYKWRAEGAYHK